MDVKFFPKQQHMASVCAHRFGKQLTVSETTDTIQNVSRYACEYYGFKNNIRVGAYIGKHYPTDSFDIDTIEAMGNIRPDVYLNTGAVAGSYAEAIAIILPWFRGLTNRTPSAVSFAGGNEALAANTINDFLGGRNSRTGDSQYGKLDDDYLGEPQQDYTRSVYANLTSTTRWYDDGLTWEQVADIINGVKDTGGWYRNFTHWHHLYTDSALPLQDSFYQTIKTAVGNDAHYCSAGEALEYLVYRQLITRVACYDSINGNVRIAIEVSGLFLQDRLNTPISISVDLSDSVLAGKNIRASAGDIIKTGADTYTVQIPFRPDTADDKIMIIELFEDLNGGDYRHFVQPSGAFEITGNSIQVLTDTITMARLFAKTTGEGEEKYKLSGSSMSFINNHIFSISSGYDYAVGIIDKWGNQNLITI